LALSGEKRSGVSAPAPALDQTVLSDGVSKIIRPRAPPPSPAGVAEAMQKALRLLSTTWSACSTALPPAWASSIGSEGHRGRAAKTVGGARCKQSGMFWSRPGRKRSSPSAAFTSPPHRLLPGKSDSTTGPARLAWPPDPPNLSCARRRNWCLPSPMVQRGYPCAGVLNLGPGGGGVGESIDGFH